MFQQIEGMIQRVASGARLKRWLAAALLALALAFSAARPAEAFLDKTRFLAHLGIAYFCFHHWVLNPYRQGAFAAGAPHRDAAANGASIKDVPVAVPGT